MMIPLSDIKAAYRLIRRHVMHTPLIPSPTLSGMFGTDIHLKLENLQRTGSFKIRGAMNRIMKTPRSIGPQGIVAASAGNHAQGVALAAREANLPATIVMPEWASISKQEATRAYGGDVILEGDTLDESLAAARKRSESGQTFIHPFDDPDVIAGQGTLGLEIVEDLPEVDTLVIPVGGGGLISGVAMAVKSVNPHAKVIGVQAAACPAAYESFASGKITTVDSRDSLADGISVKTIGSLTLKLIRRWVDEMYIATEEHIAAAILWLLERKKILAEGAAATPLAALLGGELHLTGGKTVLLISGGNVDSPLLDRIIHRGLVNKGRVMQIGISLNDKPGSLARLLTLVAGQRANVLHIHHDRNLPGMSVNTTRVKLELETRSRNHQETVIRRISEAGYRIHRD